MSTDSSIKGTGCKIDMGEGMDIVAALRCFRNESTRDCSVTVKEGFKVIVPVQSWQTPRRILLEKDEEVERTRTLSHCVCFPQRAMCK